MRVPIFKVDTSLQGDGKTHRIGWFTEENGRIVADPPSATMTNLMTIPVLTKVDGQLQRFNPHDHPRQWLTYLNHALRGYIFAGSAELTPEERKPEEE